MKAIAQILFTILLFYSPSISQVYVVNAYKGGTLPSPVMTVFVDLETKKILNEIVTGDEGVTINKKALPVLRGSDTLLITAAMEGCFCDNSIVGKNRAKISVFNPRTERLVYSNADSNLFVDWFEPLPEGKVYINAETLKEPRQSINGDYILGPNYEFELINQRPVTYNYGLYDSLAPFSYLIPALPSHDIYLGHYSEIYALVKTNSDRSVIIDTLILNNEPYRSHIFAFRDTLIYDFNLNWEIHAKFESKEFDENRINSHLDLYRLSDFSLIDSLPVADYPKGDYPDGDFDVADVVGPYIVHYFFGRDGVERYAPAMLFIFDTRTNEATWLRVGWR
jgi:hypothetical protein